MLVLSTFDLSVVPGNLRGALKESLMNLLLGPFQ